jgi:Domain of unknown function (DUF4136)
VKLRMRTAAAVVGLAVAVIAWASGGRVAAADTDITIEYDKTFSFAGLNTWAWHPDGAGDVRLALTPDDDPKRVAARLEPVILPATERELASRKIARVAADRAQLLLHYYALMTLKDFAQVHGQFLPALPDWGLPPFSASTSAIGVYPVGTIVMDITVPNRDGIVWRGAARREVNFENSDQKRREVIEKAIRDLFKDFPPRPRK